MLLLHKDLHLHWEHIARMKMMKAIPLYRALLENTDRLTLEILSRTQGHKICVRFLQLNSVSNSCHYQHLKGRQLRFLGPTVSSNHTLADYFQDSQ